MTDQNNAAQPGENLLDYAMAIAHERELDVTGRKHDSDGAVRRFKAAVERALLSKLRAEGVQAGDERTAQRNDGFSSLSLWWTMIEAEAELVGEPIKDDAPILSFMGCGASHQVTAGEIRAALASAPVAGEAPTDDEIIDMAVEPLGIDCDRMPYGVVIFARALLARYAAPQASEAALEACRLVVERFWPTEHDYIFSKRMAIQKCRAALSPTQPTGGRDEA